MIDAKTGEKIDLSEAPTWMRDLDKEYMRRGWGEMKITFGEEATCFVMSRKPMRTSTDDSTGNDQSQESRKQTDQEKKTEE